MSALSDASTHLAGLHEQLPAPGADALAALRETGREGFAAQGLPHTKLEEWRYTSLAALAKVPFALPARRDISRSDLESVASPVSACSLHGFVDGRYDPALSALGAGAEPYIASLSSLSGSELGEAVA